MAQESLAGRKYIYFLVFHVLASFLGRDYDVAALAPAGSRSYFQLLAPRHCRGSVYA